MTTEIHRMIGQLTITLGFTRLITLPDLPRMVR